MVFAIRHGRVLKEDDSNVLLDLKAFVTNGNGSLSGLWASMVL